MPLSIVFNAAYSVSPKPTVRPPSPLTNNPASITWSTSAFDAFRSLVLTKSAVVNVAPLASVNASADAAVPCHLKSETTVGLNPILISLPSAYGSITELVAGVNANLL